MLNCFLCAMESEAKPILEKVDVLESTKIGYATLYACSDKGKKFFVAVCGVGKVFSASGFSGIIVAHPEIDRFINVGIGGSLNAEKAPLLSAVVGDSFVQHDMDTSAVDGCPRGFLWGIELIKIPGEKGIVKALASTCENLDIPVYCGTIVSGDTFVADEEKKKGFVEEFDAISVDMEAAAYATVAYVYGKPFTALRIISDAVDHYAEYLLYKGQAAEKASEVALAFLRNN